MRCHRLVGGAAVAGVLSGCGGSSAPATLTWQPEHFLSAASGSGAAPSFAVATDGHVTAAWVSAPGNGKDGRLTVRADVNDSTQTTVVDPAGALTIYGETPPKIAYGPDGTLYAAYLVTKAVPHRQWPVNALRFTSSADHGAHWTDATTIQADTANGGSTDDHALLVAPDGTIYISWLALVHDTSHTYVSRSADRGKSWSAPVVVDQQPSCPCCRTTLTAGPDGTLYVAWRKIYGSGAGEIRDIAIAASSDQGKTWSAPVRVHQDDWHVSYCPDAGPSVRVGRDGVIHVAWWTGKPGSAGVQYTQSRDSGRTFTAPIPLGVAPASRAAHAQVAFGSAGAIIVAWDDGTRATPPVVVRVSRDGGKTFGPAETLTRDGWSGGYPVVSIARDTVRVAWQQRSDAGTRTDSAKHLAEVEAIKHAPPTAPTAEQWINPVGSWSVVIRSAVFKP